MARRANRRDANHIEIRDAFRRLGFSVKDVADLKNFCDLLVSKNGYTWCIEVKDGTLPPSKRRLTEGEDIFMHNWQGNYAIVMCIEDVEKVNNAIILASK